MWLQKVLTELKAEGEKAKAEGEKATKAGDHAKPSHMPSHRHLCFSNISTLP